MKLQLNGAPVDVPVTTLADLLETQGLQGVKAATAVNGTFVPAPERGEFVLSDGDAVEVLAPMQGG